MTIHDLIYKTTAQIIEDGYVDEPYVCSKCGCTVKPEEIRCPHCRAWFISENDIKIMTEQLIATIAKVLIKNIRGDKNDH